MANVKLEGHQRSIQALGNPALRGAALGKLQNALGADLTIEDLRPHLEPLKGVVDHPLLQMLAATPRPQVTTIKFSPEVANSFTGLFSEFDAISKSLEALTAQWAAIKGAVDEEKDLAKSGVEIFNAAAGDENNPASVELQKIIGEVDSRQAWIAGTAGALSNLTSGLVDTISGRPADMTIPAQADKNSIISEETKKGLLAYQDNLIKAAQEIAASAKTWGSVNSAKDKYAAAINKVSDPKFERFKLHIQNSIADLAVHKAEVERLVEEAKRKAEELKQMAERLMAAIGDRPVAKPAEKAPSKLTFTDINDMYKKIDDIASPEDLSGNLAAIEQYLKGLNAGGRVFEGLSVELASVGVDRIKDELQEKIAERTAILLNTGKPEDQAFADQFTPKP